MSRRKKKPVKDTVKKQVVEKVEKEYEDDFHICKFVAPAGSSQPVCEPCGAIPL